MSPLLDVFNGGILWESAVAEVGIERIALPQGSVMQQQRIAVVVIAVGLLIQAVARMASVRDTPTNAVLTGVGVVVLIAGLVMLWKARKAGRDAST